MIFWQAKKYTCPTKKLPSYRSVADVFQIPKQELTTTNEIEKSEFRVQAYKDSKYEPKIAVKFYSCEEDEVKDRKNKSSGEFRERNKKRLFIKFEMIFVYL